MKQSTTLFLQTVIVLIGTVALIFLLWEPHLEGRNAQATVFEIYFNDPFLACAYLASIPFFVALFQAFTWLGFAAQRQQSSAPALRALRLIRLCAFCLIAAALLAQAYFFGFVKGQDDIAGGVFMTLLVLLASIGLALGASWLQKRTHQAPFKTSRQIPASVAQVWAAFSDPQRLARWWGPAGFSNTFKTCDFQTGGQWSYVMHGPDGKNYPNESVFAEVTPLKRVVIEHGSLPKYRLTITLSEVDGGTLVEWVQAFEDAKVAKAIEGIVAKGNEENLERLAREVG